MWWVGELIGDYSLTADERFLLRHFIVKGIMAVVDCDDREVEYFYNHCINDADSRDKGKYLYVLENFRHKPQTNIVAHKRVMLSFPYNHIPPCSLPICCTFPARRPMTWMAPTSPLKHVPAWNPKWRYRFADEPVHFLTHTEAALSWNRLQQEYVEWRREKRYWRRRLRMPDELMRCIEEWLGEAGFTGGRLRHIDIL